jgi:hypothetical protein
MEFLMDFFELSIRDMCIDLCGRDAFMSEHFLDRPDVSAILE